MRLDRDTVTYFKSIAGEMGIPYQSLINLYLRDCAMHNRKLHMKWASKKQGKVSDFQKTGPEPVAYGSVHPYP